MSDIDNQVDFQDKLQDIKKNISEWHRYFQKNIVRYHKYKNAVFNTSISSEDKSVVESLNRPLVEVNGLETYLSRLRGEFASQTPSPLVTMRGPAEADEQLVDFIEGHLRAIHEEANNDQFDNEIWKDTLGGGFSVATVWTDYESPKSFDQCIKMGRVFSPTLCGFDPTARTPTKCDGTYAFEHFPMYENEAEKLFGIDCKGVSYIREGNEFSWYYENGSKKVVMVCHYYEKEKETRTLVRLADNSDMFLNEYEEMLLDWDDITNPPAIIEKRDTKITTIVRYILVGNKIIERKETSFTELPYVFIDGNSVQLRENEGDPEFQMTRPLVYHAMDMQRMKNFFAQSFLNEVQSLTQGNVIMPTGALPQSPEYLKAWLEPQIPALRLYEQYDQQTSQPNQPPSIMPRAPIPPEIYNAFVNSDENIRHILSSFDPSVALNSNDISGKAIIEGVAQSNATAMPYLMNYVSALGQVFRIAMDLIPRLYITPRSLPTIDQDGKRAFQLVNGGAHTVGTQFDPDDLNLRVETGVNFRMQNQKSVDVIAKLSQAFPNFAQLVNEDGIPIILDMLEIKGVDQLKEAYSKKKEQQEAQQMAMSQQGAQQPNPEMMDLDLRAKKIEADNHRAMLDAEIDKLKLDLQARQLELDAAKLEENSKSDRREQDIQLVKSETERLAKLIDLHLSNKKLDD